MTRFYFLIGFIVLLRPLPVLALEFTEIGYSYPGADEHHEWVELHNELAAPVDLTGNYFSDGSFHLLIAPPEKGSQGSLIMEPNAYLVLADDAAQFLLDHPGYNGSVIDTVMSLPNYSASRLNPIELAVTDKQKQNLAMIGYVPTQQGSDQSLSLMKLPDGSWVDGQPGGSPGQENTTPVSQPLVTGLSISEVMSNPEGADPDHEWVEFYNGNDSPIKLEGFSLRNKAGVRQTMSVEMAGQSYYVYGARGSLLTNSDESIELQDPQGRTIVSLAVSGLSQEGQSYADVNGIWQWTNRPTPGQANLLSEKAAGSPAVNKLTQASASSTVRVASPSSSSKSGSGVVSIAPAAVARSTSKVSPKVSPRKSPKTSPETSPIILPSGLAEVAGVSIDKQPSLPVIPLIVSLIVFTVTLGAVIYRYRLLIIKMIDALRRTWYSER